MAFWEGTLAPDGDLCRITVLFLYPDTIGAGL